MKALFYLLYTTGNGVVTGASGFGKQEPTCNHHSPCPPTPVDRNGNFMALLACELLDASSLPVQHWVLAPVSMKEAVLGDVRQSDGSHSPLSL